MKKDITFIILSTLFCISVILEIILIANYDSKENIYKEGEDIMSENVIVVIDDNVFNVNIEDNETAKEFCNILPQEFNMSELNGNEKYIYLDTTFTTNSYNPKHIEKGDIMLYGNNCLVVFYKSFNTSYSYTKIGHIDNLPDLGKDSISIKFEKN